MCVCVNLSVSVCVHGCVCVCVRGGVCGCAMHSYAVSLCEIVIENGLYFNVKTFVLLHDWLAS